LFSIKALQGCDPRADTHADSHRKVRNLFKKGGLSKRSNMEISLMKNRFLAVGAIVAGIALPLAAQAQGVPGGAAQGAADGAAVAGPVGGVIGGVVGGVAGGVAGVLGVDQRPRVRQYIVQERRPSYRYNEQVRVGAVLPSSGVQYYELPAEYGARNYRYTVVNERPVLVDPQSHRIVEVIE
jgi:hypothetical protein